MGKKKFVTPKYLWSTTGGITCNPRHWKRDTFLTSLVLLGACSVIAYISTQLERRPVPPYRHIPSQRWCKYAKIDDPSLP